MITTIKRISISHRTRPMWTLTDLSGQHVFPLKSKLGEAVLAFPTKREAMRIQEFLKMHGLEKTKTKLGLEND